MAPGVLDGDLGLGGRGPGGARGAAAARPGGPAAVTNLVPGVVDLEPGLGGVGVIAGVAGPGLLPPQRVGDG